MHQLENLIETMPEFEGMSMGIFDTKLCHMGRQLDPNFQNGLIP